MHCISIMELLKFATSGLFVLKALLAVGPIIINAYTCINNITAS